MQEEKRTYSANLKEGQFLFFVDPYRADFILVEVSRLEKIVRRTPLINYEVLIHTESKRTYLGHQILAYAKKIS